MSCSDRFEWIEGNLALSFLFLFFSFLFGSRGCGVVTELHLLSQRPQFRYLYLFRMRMMRSRMSCSPFYARFVSCLTEGNPALSELFDLEILRSVLIRLVEGNPALSVCPG